MNLQEQFKNENGYDAFAYDKDGNVVGFCQNYVEWLELKINNSTNESFESAVEPAIRYLFKNHHPHTKIYINYSTAELLEGQQCHNLNNEVPD